MEDRTLASLREGEWARIKGLDAEQGIGRRLRDLGMIGGTKVQCIQKSPFGDPTAYAVRGAIIALRSKDAALVRICGAEGMRG